MKTGTRKCFSTTILFLFFCVNALNSQSLDPAFWAKNGNAVFGAGNTFGTFYFGPINIFTNSTFRALFTTGNLLSNPAGYFGDGLRFRDLSGGIGHLDLWTSTSQTTHIKWDGSGEVSGQNSRLEVIGNYTGLWLNGQTTTLGPARIFFNINGTECGRFNSAPNNRFMRIGLNPGSIDAARRLEVFDAAGVPQFRISQTSGIDFTDFQTTPLGYLGILPSGLRVGVNINSPTNTLDVNGTCRVRNLANVTQTDVVVTDANGVLFRMPISTLLVPFGGPCNNLPVLGANAGVNLNNNNFHFVGTQLGSAVGIGTNCLSSVIAKLTVLQNSGNTNGTIGSLIVNSDVSLSSLVYGIQSIVNPTAPSFADIGYTAGYFAAHGAKLNIGVDGLADGLAGNGAANYGGQFIARNGGANIGIYAEGLPVSGNTPPNGLNFAGYFNGDVTRTGTDNFTSDVNLKTNITPIINAWSILSQLTPKTFLFDTVSHPFMGLPRKRQYGFVAQDIEPILPELVSTIQHPAKYDSLGNVVTPSVLYKTLNYQAFIGLMMAGMMEMKQLLDTLTLQYNNMRTAENISIPTTKITLENSRAILFQNSPNPFGEFTVIRYIIPEGVFEAEIVFYDEFGNEINRTRLQDRGNAKIDINSKNLASGIYAYSLISDGSVVDTKVMIKTK